MSDPNWSGVPPCLTCLDRGVVAVGGGFVFAGCPVCGPTGIDTPGALVVNAPPEDLLEWAAAALLERLSQHECPSCNTADGNHTVQCEIGAPIMLLGIWQRRDPQHRNAAALGAAVAFRVEPIPPPDETFHHFRTQQVWETSSALNMGVLAVPGPDENWCCECNGLIDPTSDTKCLSCGKWFHDFDKCQRHACPEKTK